MNDKKELTLKQRQQRNKLLVYPLMGFAFCLVMYFIFAPSVTKENKEDLVNGFNAEVPLPADQVITADKKTAYEQEQLRKQQEEKMKSLQDYAFALTGKGNEAEELDLKIEEENTITEQPQTNNNGGHSHLHSIEASNNAYRNMTRELNSLYSPSANDNEKKKLEEKIEELTKQLEENTKGTQSDQQIDLMEKSYKLAAKYLTNGTPAAIQQTEKTVATVQPGATNSETNLTPVTGVIENIVSQLKQEITDSAFMAECIKPRNMGFITPVKNGEKSARNTISACILENQVLDFGNNEDHKVRFRLLEDVQAGKTIIPRNSIFSGDAKIQGGRLNITVNSIEYAGNIISVKIQVYDLDGQKGIAARGSQETDALKEAASGMSANMGTAITFTQNAGQQVATDLAKTAVQTGAQYLSKKIKTVKITLKANHQVLLLAQN